MRVANVPNAIKENTENMTERNRIKCCFCGHSKQNHKLTFEDDSIMLSCLVCLNLPRPFGGICLEKFSDADEGEVEDEA